MFHISPSEMCAALNFFNVVSSLKLRSPAPNAKTFPELLFGSLEKHSLGQLGPIFANNDLESNIEWVGL